MTSDDTVLKESILNLIDEMISTARAGDDEHLVKCWLAVEFTLAEENDPKFSHLKNAAKAESLRQVKIAIEAEAQKRGFQLKGEFYDKARGSQESHPGLSVQEHGSQAQGSRVRFNDSLH